jgi:signal transduction histidine kinase/CheY-like chemotaxis protein
VNEACLFAFTQKELSIKSPPKPLKEFDRLADLKAYGILDTAPTQESDDLALLASEICQTPIALISLVDSDRQWFQAKVGLSAPETPREYAFCAHAIVQDEVFVVPDAFKDERFHDNPFVTGAPYVRFYAGAPLKTPSGNNIGTLCVIDSAPRTLTERQYAALKALSRQVVTQFELRKSISQLAGAHEAKSRFLATMSHEIRTPLNAILSFTDLLSDRVADLESRHLLGLVHHSGEALLTVVNDVLEYSRIEAGHLRIHKAAFNLYELARKSIDMISAGAQQAGLAFVLDYDQEAARQFHGDEGRIRQILINLLSNAERYARSRVCLRVEPGPPGIGTRLVRFAVIDDGLGIHPDDQPLLFRSFSQIQSDSAQALKGTGLGLAICKGLVTAMSGTIGLTSTPGEGTVFHFEMPLSAAGLSIDPEVRREEARLHQDTLGRLKILVAEDNPINQRVAEGIFRRLGCKISLASNGKLAVEAVERERFDLVFMDLQMPVLDGLAATREIRQRLGQAIPIYAMTASVLDEDQRRCKEVGMNGFLLKPIEVPKLTEILLAAAEQFEQPSTLDGVG